VYIEDHLDEIPWHTWYAWHPVKTSSGWIWLKYVCRKGISQQQISGHTGMYIEAVRRWEYKETIFDILKDSK
jgi:hypothetical protein